MDVAYRYQTASTSVTERKVDLPGRPFGRVGHLALVAGLARSSDRTKLAEAARRLARLRG